MGIVSRLDERLGCTFVVWVGNVTLDEWHAHFQSLLDDPRFPPGKCWLVDARRAKVDLMDDAAIADMGARMNDAAERLGGMRLAIVPNGAWAKASKLIDEELTVQRLTAIQFNSFDTACVWLGIASGTARSIVDEMLAEPNDA